MAPKPKARKSSRSRPRVPTPDVPLAASPQPLKKKRRAGRPRLKKPVTASDGEAGVSATVSTNASNNLESDEQSVAQLRSVMGLEARSGVTLAQTLIEWQMRHLNLQSTGSPTTGTTISLTSTTSTLPIPISSSASTPVEIGNPSSIASRSDLHVARRNPVRIKIPMPVFAGLQDPRNPALFVKDLERFGEAHGYSEEQMIGEVLKVALVGPAKNWFDFMEFSDWGDFVTKFRTEYQSSAFRERMKQQLSARTQAPGEPLLSFIAEVKTFHDEYLPSATESDIVEHILKSAHPDYSKYLFNRGIVTMRELRLYAELIHKQVELDKSYKPPPSRSQCDDPKLGFDKTPFTLPAAQQKKAVINQNSQVPRTGGNAQALGQKKPRCWKCKAEGHLSKDCTEKVAVNIKESKN
jgi:hypothetical protein